MISDSFNQVDLPFILRTCQNIIAKTSLHNASSISIISFFVVILISEVLRRRARVPKIDGPNGVPILGNFHQLGPDPGERLRLWSKQYGEIYQIMMGNMPVVVFNSMQAARDVFVGQGGALVDRPRFYTFHSVVSSVASSVGTTPWSESTKRRRKAAASAMNRPGVESYIPFLDELSRDLLQGLLEKGQSGKRAFDPKPSIQHVILDLTMTVNYGTRLPKDKALFEEILYIEDNVSRFRSTTGALQDYVPFMRLNPINLKSAHAKEINRRRLVYLNRFNRELEERIANGTDRACIQGNVLKDPDAKLNDLELLSISMTMVSGGLDTMVNTLSWTVGALAQRPDIQDRAYNAICDVYGTVSWGPAEDEIGVPYIAALVKESLRYSTIFRISLPRTAWRDISYKDMFIPKGTTVFLNAWAINRDEELFGSDVDEFRPERYLESDNATAASLPAHASYGFGTRMCAGSHLANRQLYIILLRLIWAFQIEPSRDSHGNDWSLRPLEDTVEPYHLAAFPPRYNARFVPRHEIAFA